MFKFEENIVNAIVNKKNVLFFIVITILGFVVRYQGFDLVSLDMSSAFLPWYNMIKENGSIHSLGQQIGEYGILYQTTTALLTYLDVNALYAYKMFAIVFDYMLAFSIAVFISQIKNTKMFSLAFNIAYMVILMLPTDILNAGYWGQCDSMYTTFLVLTMAYLYKEKYVLAFIYYGLGLAFKFQVIFILPAIIIYYLYKRNFSIFMLGISIVTFWSTGILAYLQGANLLAQFKIYMHQANTFPKMWRNITSFWVLVGDNYEFLSGFAILTTLTLCGTFLYLVISNKKQMGTIEQYLNTFTWVLWTCILFLPAMHERYTYPLDILLVVLCFIDKKYIKYAALSCTLSLITYGKYLFNNGGIDSKFYVIIYLFAWIYYTYEIIKIDNTTEVNREIQVAKN